MVVCLMTMKKGEVFVCFVNLTSCLFYFPIEHSYHAFCLLLDTKYTKAYFPLSPTSPQCQRFFVIFQFQLQFICQTNFCLHFILSLSISPHFPFSALQSVHPSFTFYFVNLLLTYTFLCLYCINENNWLLKVFFFSSFSLPLKFINFVRKYTGCTKKTIRKSRFPRPTGDAMVSLKLVPNM